MTPPPRHDGAEVCIHGHPWTVDNIYVDPKGKPHCATCRAARARRWEARHPDRVKRHNTIDATVARAERAAHVRTYKLERGCADCGYNAHAEALDLDHRDHSTKDDAVSYLVSIRAAWPRLLAELEKCDVVCANCHRVRTYSGANLHPAHAFRRRTA